jgi:hypothetical protein
MIAITTVEVQNLIYVAGALVLIIILSLVVTLRHRRPKSVESNMATFNKGLKALAPGTEPVRRSGSAGRRGRPAPAVVKSSLPPRTNTVHTIRPVPVSEPATEPDDEPQGEGTAQEPAGEASGSSSEESQTTTVRIDATNDTPTTLEAETG